MHILLRIPLEMGRALLERDKETIIEETFAQFNALYSYYYYKVRLSLEFILVQE